MAKKQTEELGLIREAAVMAQTVKQKEADKNLRKSIQQSDQQIIQRTYPTAK